MWKNNLPLGCSTRSGAKGFPWLAYWNYKPGAKNDGRYTPICKPKKGKTKRDGDPKWQLMTRVVQKHQGHLTKPVQFGGKGVTAPAYFGADTMVNALNAYIQDRISNPCILYCGSGSLVRNWEQQPITNNRVRILKTRTYKQCQHAWKWIYESILKEVIPETNAVIDPAKLICKKYTVMGNYTERNPDWGTPAKNKPNKYDFQSYSSYPVRQTPYGTRDFYKTRCKYDYALAASDKATWEAVSIKLDRFDGHVQPRDDGLGVDDNYFFGTFGFQSEVMVRDGERTSGNGQPPCIHMADRLNSAIPDFTAEDVGICDTTTGDGDDDGDSDGDGNKCAYCNRGAGPCYYKAQGLTVCAAQGANGKCPSKLYKLCCCASGRTDAGVAWARCSPTTPMLYKKSDNCGLCDNNHLNKKSEGCPTTSDPKNDKSGCGCTSGAGPCYFARPEGVGCVAKGANGKCGFPYKLCEKSDDDSTTECKGCSTGSGPCYYEPQGSSAGVKICVAKHSSGVCPNPYVSLTPCCSVALPYSFRGSCFFESRGRRLTASRWFRSPIQAMLGCDHAHTPCVPGAQRICVCSAIPTYATDFRAPFLSTRTGTKRARKNRATMTKRRRRRPWAGRPPPPRCLRTTKTNPRASAASGA